MAGAGRSVPAAHRGPEHILRGALTPRPLPPWLMSCSKAIEDRLPGLQLPQGDGLITAHTYRGAHENRHAPLTVR
jgi:hypothetical protein